MATSGQLFYGQSALFSFSAQDVLAGRVVKINPALITLTDGLVGSFPPSDLQRAVTDQVRRLVKHKVFTFHLDINYPDYGGYGRQRPEYNTAVFSPAFVGRLNDFVRSQGKYLNLHLLTDHPLERVRNYQLDGVGAVCFQLEAVAGGRELNELVDHILAQGACASPVIETVGSEYLRPPPSDEVLAKLEPVLPKLGMLTFQVAGTASRSTQSAGTLARDRAREYIQEVRRNTFSGTIQLQGGIKTATIGDAVGLGAEFLVSGSEIFYHPSGLAPSEVIERMLVEASNSLTATQQ